MPSILELLPEDILFQIIPHLDCRSITMTLEAYPWLKRYAIIITSYHFGPAFFKGDGIKTVHLPCNGWYCYSCGNPRGLEYYNEMKHGKFRIKLIELHKNDKTRDEGMLSNKLNFVHPPNLADPCCFVYLNPLKDADKSPAMEAARALNDIGVKWCSTWPVGLSILDPFFEDQVELHKNAAFFDLMKSKAQAAVITWSPSLTHLDQIEYLKVEGASRFSDLSFPKLKELSICIQDGYEALTEKIGQQYGEIRNLSLPSLMYLSIHYHEMLPVIWGIDLVLDYEFGAKRGPFMCSLEIGDIRLLDSNGPSFTRYSSRQNWTRESMSRHIDPCFAKQFRKRINLCGTPAILLEYCEFRAYTSLTWVKSLEEPPVEQNSPLFIDDTAVFSITVLTSKCILPQIRRGGMLRTLDLRVMAPGVNIKGIVDSPGELIFGLSHLLVYKPLRVVKMEESSQYDEVFSDQKGWESFFKTHTQETEFLKQLSFTGYCLPFLFKDGDEGKPLDVTTFKWLDLMPLIRLKEINGNLKADEMNNSNSLVVNGLSVCWRFYCDLWYFQCTPMFISDASRSPCIGIEHTMDLHISLNHDLYPWDEDWVPAIPMLQVKSCFKNFYFNGMLLDTKNTCEEWRDLVKRQITSGYGSKALEEIDPNMVEAHQWFGWRRVLDTTYVPHRPVPIELRIDYIPKLRIPEASRFGVYGVDQPDYFWSLTADFLGDVQYEDDYAGTHVVVNLPQMQR